NNLTLTLALTFKPAFIGTKNIYMGLFSSANVFSGWQTQGTWSVSGALPPASVSVSPSSGTGTTQAFTFVYSDATDINWGNILFQTQVTGANACFVQYFRAANSLLLVGDSGSGNAGTATLGSPGAMSNSQCTVDSVASSVSTSGNNLTLTLALTFKPAFNGAK